MTDITVLMEFAIVLIGALLTIVVAPYIKSKTTAAQQDIIQKWVDIAVCAAEQLNREPGKGVEKKDYVWQFLENRGITYDVDAIDSMIEASVKMLNIAQGKPGE